MKLILENFIKFENEYELSMAAHATSCFVFDRPKLKNIFKNSQN